MILCDEPDAVKAILNGELEKIDRELQDGKQNLALEIRDTAANVGQSMSEKRKNTIKFAKKVFARRKICFQSATSPRATTARKMP